MGGKATATCRQGSVGAKLTAMLHSRGGPSRAQEVPSSNQSIASDVALASQRCQRSVANSMAVHDARARIHALYVPSRDHVQSTVDCSTRIASAAKHTSDANGLHGLSKRTQSLDRPESAGRESGGQATSCLQTATLWL